MKNITIYEAGEEVLIKAKIMKVLVERERIQYELIDQEGNVFKHRFSDKDIYPLPVAAKPEEEKAEETEEKPEEAAEE